MKKLISFCALLLLSFGSIACRNEAMPDSNVVAIFDGGQITLRDVEEVLLSMPAEDRIAHEGDIVSSYRETARKLVLTRVLIPESASRESSLQYWRQENPEIYLSLVVRLFLKFEMGVDENMLTVTPEEIEIYYENHPSVFSRKESRLLHSIFRRVSKEEDRNAALSLLSDVKKRVLHGEPFDGLAREFSHSETRAMGGALGWINQGVLPPSLDRVAFSLGSGEVSDPISIPDGLVLLYVERAVDARHHSLEDVSVQIRQVLLKEKLRDVLNNAADELQAPANSVVLNSSELLAAVESKDEDLVILRVFDAEINLGTFLKMFAPAEKASITKESILSLYENITRNHLLYAEAVRSGYIDRADVQALLEESLRRTLEGPMLTERLTERIRNNVNEKELKAFFEENNKRYLTPVRLNIRQLVVRDVHDFPAQMLQLEAMRGQLVKGTTTLENVAAEVNGEIVETGWHVLTQLHMPDPKVAHYLVEVDGIGFTVAHRTGNTLQILEIADRDEPAPSSFEEVRDRVMDSFLERYRNQLWEKTINEILASVHFEFLENNVVDSLQIPTPDGGTGTTGNSGEVIGVTE